MSPVQKPAREEAEQPFLTLKVGGQLCGVQVAAVRDILSEQPITHIPLAPPEIAGSLNLRGRIVTAIDLRSRLRLSPAKTEARRMSVVAEQGGELYALLVDEVAEVIPLLPSAMEHNPPTLPASWATYSSGIFRLDGKLMVVLDTERLLAVEAGPARSASQAEAA